MNQAEGSSGIPGEDARGMGPKRSVWKDELRAATPHPRDQGAGDGNPKDIILVVLQSGGDGGVCKQET